MTYVWAAYTLIWLFIFGYTLLLNSRQKKIEREILLLKQAIDAVGTDPDASSF